MYPRPPSFVNRASGQFIISTFAAISLGLAYPLVYLVGSYVDDAKIYALNIENEKLTAESTKYKKILKDKKDKINALDKRINKASKIYSSKTKTLTAIYDKKVNYRLKSGVLYTIAEDLYKYDVQVDKVNINNDTMLLSIISSDDRKFTEVIKYISDTHFNEINQIDIELIEKSPDSSYYKGLLKVELK